MGAVQTRHEVRSAHEPLAETRISVPTGERVGRKTWTGYRLYGRHLFVKNRCTGHGQSVPARDCFDKVVRLPSAGVLLPPARGAAEAET